MSSLFYAELGTPNVKCSKHCVVSAEQEHLPDYVRRVMSEKALNYREVARRSGGVISHTTVFDVVNQRTKDVKTETLTALAKGLGVSEDEIFAVARGMATAGELPLDEVRVLEFYRALPAERKEDALAHLELDFQRHGLERPLLSAVAGTPRSVKKPPKK